MQNITGGLYCQLFCSVEPRLYSFSRIYILPLKMQKSPCKTLYRRKHKMPHNNTEKDHRVTKGRRDGTGGSPRRWGCRARAPDSYGHPISVPSNPKFTGLMEIVMETFYCQAWYPFGWKGCAQEIRGELWVSKRPHDTIKNVLACICETDKVEVYMALIG